MGSGSVLGLAPAPEYTFLIYVSPVGNYFKVLYLFLFIFWQIAHLSIYVDYILCLAFAIKCSMLVVLYRFYSFLLLL